MTAADPDDTCDFCGHRRSYHIDGANCYAESHRCGDGCCSYPCECSEFREDGKR